MVNGDIAHRHITMEARRGRGQATGAQVRIDALPALRRPPGLDARTHTGESRG